MVDIPKITAKSGFEMPIVGFGTWQSSADDTERAVECALSSGYRLIDTAYVYQNENAIGDVLQRWFKSGKLKRQDIFVTTKLPFIGNRPEHVEKFLNLSLERLQLSYVDLYLIHAPFGLNYADDDTWATFKPNGDADIDLNTDLLALWKKMEEQVDCSKAKWIGVSNFNRNQVERILAEARIPPANNQIQLHAYFQQPDLVKYLQDQDISVTSYSTLGSAGTSVLYSYFGHESEIPSILSNEVVQDIATEVERTPAQVLLRHMIQKGIAVIPKSVQPERIQSNLNLFDFNLDDGQMKKLDELDKNLLLVDFKLILKNIDRHPEYPFQETNLASD